VESKNEKSAFDKRSLVKIFVDLYFLILPWN